MDDDCYLCLAPLRAHRYRPLLLPSCRHPVPVPCALPWFAAHSSCPQCRAPVAKLPVAMSAVVTARTTGVAVRQWFEAERAAAVPAFLLVTDRGLLLQRRRPAPGPRWRLFEPVARPEWADGLALFQCRYLPGNAALWLALHTDAAAAAPVRAALTCFDRPPPPRAAWSQTSAS